MSINNDRQREEEIGRNNEQIALGVAKQLFSEGVYPLDCDGYGPELTMPYSDDDIEGIDLWIPAKRGLVGIQIKSSSIYADKFANRNPNGRVIPVVIIKSNSTPESIRMDLLAAINWAQDTWYPEN